MADEFRTDVTVNFQLYDSEILALEKQLDLLTRKIGTQTNLEGFRNEIIDRLGRVGFKVSVKVFSTDQPGVYAFDIDIVDRLANNPWDPDKMVHEVTHDLLELGEGGVIKTTKDDYKRMEGH